MGFDGAQARAGLFVRGKREKQQSVQGLSIKFLHQAQCAACPLNNVRGNKSPHMEPYGSDEPIVYILGEAPGEVEDRKDQPFVGPAGQLLRWRMPKGWDDEHLRWSNVVRTRPPDNRTPELAEIEACRPSVVKDIARTKPLAIFGFGNVPLEWAIQQSGITRWSNRRIPVTIGGHTCWYYPILHPSAVLHNRKFDPSRLDEYGCSDEFVFQRNLDWAFTDVEEAPDPVVHTEEDALDGIDCITGQGSGDLDRLLDFLEDCYDEEVVGIDYECNALRPYTKDARILTAAVSNENGTVAFPFYHPEACWTDREMTILKSEWVKFLMNSKCRKVAHQVSYELEWTAVKFGIDLARNGEWDCSKGQAYVLDERQGMLSLEVLCIQYFGINIKAIANTDTVNLERTDLDTVLKYNGLDAKYHRLLAIEQDQRLVDDGLWDVYVEHMRRVRAAVLIQVKGVPVDEQAVDEFETIYQEKVDDAERELFDLPVVKKYRNKKGEGFHPGSHHDVSRILHSLGFHDFKNTKEAELEMIDRPFAQAVVAWRKPAKAISTYIHPLKRDHERSVVFPDGLLHQILACDKTVTWRTSSEDPNTQNYHKRSEMVELRKQIKARPGRKIVSIDYSGIQARNVAMESQDKALVNAFWDNYDIHSDWMERIQKVYPKFADPKKLVHDPKYRSAQRHRAKNKFVFPSLFGAQAPTLSMHLQIPVEPCEELREELWHEFPDVLKWHKHLHKFYRKHGYVTGLSGFRRRAPVEPNKIINAPIQADEAIMVCDAMARVSELDFDRFVPTLMVHDDLTWEWYDSDIEENAETVIKIMLDCPYEWAHIVPIEVEMSIGPSWGELKAVGKYSSDKWNGIVEIKRD